MATKLLLILLIVLVLFGAGKLPRVMRDLGQGMRGLREGMREDEPIERDPRVCEPVAEVLPPVRNERNEPPR